jgi:alpha-tubulin suppressor-like RCC1 family protein
VVQQVAIGEAQMACVTDQGAIYLWGRNDDFRLGLKKYEQACGEGISGGI